VISVGVEPMIFVYVGLQGQYGLTVSIQKIHQVSLVNRYAQVKMSISKKRKLWMTGLLESFTLIFWKIILGLEMETRRRNQAVVTFNILYLYIKIILMTKCSHHIIRVNGYAIGFDEEQGKNAIYDSGLKGELFFSINEWQMLVFSFFD
jgi:phosphatidylserine synthase